MCRFNPDQNKAHPHHGMPIWEGLRFGPDVTAVKWSSCYLGWLSRLPAERHSRVPRPLQGTNRYRLGSKVSLFVLADHLQKDYVPWSVMPCTATETDLDISRNIQIRTTSLPSAVVLCSVRFPINLIYYCVFLITISWLLQGSLLSSGTLIKQISWIIRLQRNPQWRKSSRVRSRVVKHSVLMQQEFSKENGVFHHLKVWERRRKIKAVMSLEMSTSCSPLTWRHIIDERRVQCVKMLNGRLIGTN